MADTLRVLYVDDEPALLDIGKHYLEWDGTFTVDTLPSAREALLQLNTEQYDAIISDYQMPEMDGITFLKQLKASGNTTPFIIFTGRGREEVVIEALNEGADFYIQNGGEPQSQFAELSHRIRIAVGRRTTEVAFKESEEKFCVLADMSPFCIAVFQGNRDVYVNDAASLMSGFSKEELYAMNFWDMIHPDSRDLLKERGLARQQGSVGSTNHEIKYVTKSQEVRWAYLSSGNITYAGKPAGVATLVDITKRKKAEDELRAAYEQLTVQEEELRAQYDSLALSQDEWESTFNAIPEWISLITPAGRILRTNKAAESLFGTPTAQILGRNCFDIIHGNECPVDGCPRRRMLKSLNRESTEIPRPDGNGWLQVTVDPVTNSSGEVVSAVHIVKDITEQMRSQKALEQAKKKLNLLNYVTFNDIQNMIFTLSGYQHLVKEKVKDNPVSSIIAKQEDILQKITHSLKFAQSYQDLGLKPPKWQNANHVFLLAISHLDFMGLQHRVMLDGLEIFADPLLEQVFQILADNTLTHGKTATEVMFRYTLEPEYVTLFFEDNGTGIAQETKDKIFLPDFQKKKGVGLFLAREILEITGISLCETGEPGKGARFEMTVPKGMWRMADGERKVN